jgi:integrase
MNFLGRKRVRNRTLSTESRPVHVSFHQAAPHLHVPSSAAALALVRLHSEAPPAGCPFLFPGDFEGQPVIELKRFWAWMREVADIPDLRIHDLRHTFASLLVSGGASLEMIGKLLGHTQIGTAQRYAI